MFCGKVLSFLSVFLRTKLPIAKAGGVFFCDDTCFKRYVDAHKNVGEYDLDPEDKTVKSGFTVKEQECFDLLTEFFNKYTELEAEHKSDLPDVVNAMHRIQDIMGMRIVRRDYPSGFWRKENDDDKKTT